MRERELLILIRQEFYRINPKGCEDFFNRRDRKIPYYVKLKQIFNGRTYNEILLLSGISDHELNFVRRDKDTYLKKIEQIIFELGYVPTQNALIQMGYTPAILKRYFGSYDKAIELVATKEQLEEYNSRKTFPCKVLEDKDKLLEMYKEFSNKIGGPASCSDLETSNEIYNAGVYSIRFGGMTQLKRIAGYNTINKNNSKYTKKQIEELLIDRYKKNGGVLKIHQIKEDIDLPCTATILKYWQTTSMREVWHEIERVIQNETAT